LKNKLRKSKAILSLDKVNTNSLQPGRIEHTLSEIVGVLQVNVNHVTNMVSVEYDHERISLEEIRKRLEQS